MALCRDNWVWFLCEAASVVHSGEDRLVNEQRRVKGGGTRGKRGLYVPCGWVSAAIRRWLHCRGGGGEDVAGLGGRGRGRFHKIWRSLLTETCSPAGSVQPPPCRLIHVLEFKGGFWGEFDIGIWFLITCISGAESLSRGNLWFAKWKDIERRILNRASSKDRAGNILYFFFFFLSEENP